MKQEFERIILPIDDSDPSKKAANKALFLAKIFGIKIIAVHVIEQNYYADPKIISNLDIHLREQARIFLKKIVNKGKKDNITVETRIITGTPYAVITEIATKNDLIIMGHKGKTNLKKILIGSVSEKVTRHAPCPVMIVR